MDVLALRMCLSAANPAKAPSLDLADWLRESTLVLLRIAPAYMACHSSVLPSALSYRITCILI